MRVRVMVRVRVQVRVRVRVRVRIRVRVRLRVWHLRHEGRYNWEMVLLQHERQLCSCVRLRL